jgi:hypothetical protein
VGSVLSVNRPIAIVGAPSSIGIRPYDDGSVRRLDLAPRVLRMQGLSARLDSRDWKDLRETPPGSDVTFVAVSSTYRF